MTRFFTVFFALFTLQCYSTAQSVNSWQEHRDLEGRFSIRSPGDLKEKVDTFNTPVGELVYHTFFYHDSLPDAENAVYMVSYCDYPEGSLHHDSTALISDFLESTAQESAFSVAGTIAWSTEINYGKYSGLHWRVDYKDGRAVIKTKAFIVRNRYYAIQTVMPKTRSMNRASDLFMDSFRLFDSGD
jgi:hypothetical protein